MRKTLVKRYLPVLVAIIIISLVLIGGYVVLGFAVNEALKSVA